MPPALHRLLLILALCAAGSAAAQPAPSPAWADEVLQAINQARAAAGLPALRAAAVLQAVAQGHSDTMARERRLTHDGFDARLDGTGRSLCVENVAGGTLDPRLLVNAWSRAPLHRRNLFEPRVREAGVAAAGRYVTLFACD